MLNESDIAIKQGSHTKSVPRFCATRWTTRVDTMLALIAKYKRILEALEQIQDTSKLNHIYNRGGEYETVLIKWLSFT